MNMLTNINFLKQSKDLWNQLAKECSKFYIYSDEGKQVSEKNFKLSGQLQYQEFISSDLLLQSFKKRKVLDIGCGTGRMTDFFANDYDEVEGIDISEEMISQAKQRLNHKNNIKLTATNGRDYPFSDKIFDLIFSYTVFQHISDESIILANFNEIARCLKPEGLAKIQLRGKVTATNKWYSGLPYDSVKIRKLLSEVSLRIIKEEIASTKKYYWLWLTTKKK